MASSPTGFQPSNSTRLGSRPPWQAMLFCVCGREIPAIAGLCTRCYCARAHSRLRFAGNRETVLERDGRRCRICGAEKRMGALHVHHRHPGCHDPSVLLTVCAACHARLHRLAAIRRWMPEPLISLWAEQHPGVAVQLQFPLLELAGSGVPA